MSQRHAFTVGAPAAVRPRCPRRRRPLVAGAASVAALCMLQLHTITAQPYEAGDPIDIVITPDDSIAIPFEGKDEAALAVSLQQCSGSSYIRMSMYYNGTALFENTQVTSNRCNRLIAEETTASADDVSTDNVCAFSRSSSIASGYQEWTTTINGTEDVNPDYVTVIVRNPGDTVISAQMVLFTEDYRAPDMDSSIERINTEPSKVDNTYYVDLEFQTVTNGGTSYCATSSGCSIYAYYLEVDEDDEDADFDFATTCQAYDGILAYEDTITTESDATSAFTTSVCVEFPQNVEATYRVYLVVSPDTSSYSRVGYGLQDQLIYASPTLSVDEDAEEYCPNSETATMEEESSGVPKRIIPTKATGTLALALAAAAAGREF